MPPHCSACRVTPYQELWTQIETWTTSTCRTAAPPSPGEGPSVGQPPPVCWTHWHLCQRSWWTTPTAIRYKSCQVVVYQAVSCACVPGLLSNWSCIASMCSHKHAHTHLHHPPCRFCLYCVCTTPLPPPSVALWSMWHAINCFGWKQRRSCTCSLRPSWH